jgi:hypothetical protein
LVGALVWLHEKKIPAEKIPFLVPLVLSVGLILAGIFVKEKYGIFFFNPEPGKALP